MEPVLHLANPYNYTDDAHFCNPAECSKQVKFQV